MPASPSDLVFAAVDPAHDDARWALEQYYAYLDAVFPEGFDPGTSDDDAYRQPNGAFVVGRSVGATVACGALQSLTPTIAEIKRMWVAEEHRGQGIGRLLVEVLEGIAAETGHTVVRLDTNRVLGPAISLYERLGYRSIDPYNDNPYAHHWFEKRLD